MALDMGGSNVRATENDLLKGNGVLEVIKEVKHAFPPCVHGRNGGAGVRFPGGLHRGVQPPARNQARLHLLLPLARRTAINHSTLVEWTKGFSASGCVGRRQSSSCWSTRSLPTQLPHVRVTAVCNDTVGTLISRSYSDPNTAVGIILGTGCNAAYMENTARITKCTTNSTTGKMIINMECGAIGDNNPSILPLLPFDVTISIPLTPERRRASTWRR